MPEGAVAGTVMTVEVPMDEVVAPEDTPVPESESKQALFEVTNLGHPRENMGLRSNTAETPRGASGFSNSKFVTKFCVGTSNLGFQCARMSRLCCALAFLA